jgi:hypothetical protein
MSTEMNDNFQDPRCLSRKRNTCENSSHFKLSMLAGSLREYVCMYLCMHSFNVLFESETI